MGFVKNLILNKCDLFIVLAILAFLVIRLGSLYQVYDSRKTVFSLDDSLAYILKAKTLVSDFRYKSTSLNSIKMDFKNSNNNRQYLRTLSRYHLTWSVTAATIHELTGVSYHTVWWSFVFLGQIIILAFTIFCVRDNETYLLNLQNLTPSDKRMEAWP